MWHFCEEPDCDYKAKEKGGLKQHKANVHDMDVVWHFCEEPDCDYKAKQKGDLKQHEVNVH